MNSQGTFPRILLVAGLAGCLFVDALGQAPPAAVVVQRYALTSAGDFPERDPKDWQVLGSNDEEKTWTVLDVRRNELFSWRHQERVFSITHPAAYNLYRLRIDRVKTPASAQAVQLAEFDLFPATTNRTESGPGLEAIISVPGVSSPQGTKEMAFDGLVETQWMDPANKNPATRASWLQVQFVHGGQQIITNLNQLLTLPKSKTLYHAPVRLEGYLVSCDPHARIFHLVDSTSVLPVEVAGPLVATEVGHRVRVEGKSLRADSLPTIVEAQVMPLSSRPPILDFVPVGGEWKSRETLQWMETEGTISFVAGNRGISILELTAENRRMTVYLTGVGVADLPSRQTNVRLRGIGRAILNSQDERIAGMLYVPRLKDVLLMKPPEREWTMYPLTPLGFLNYRQPNILWRQAPATPDKTNIGLPRWISTNQSTISRFSGFISSNGTHWVQVGDPILLPLSNAVFIGLAVTAHAHINTNLATAVFDQVSSPQETWQSTDIGAPGRPGSAHRKDGIFTLQGGGADIWGNADQFHYQYQRLEGDGTMVARVNIVQYADPWTKAGITIRESLDPSSPFVHMLITAGQRAAFQFRINTGDGCYGADVTNNILPGWLKVERFTGSNLLETAGSIPITQPGTLIHVRGIVVDQQPGEFLTIQDRSGSIRLLTDQSERVPNGAEIEALGQLEYQEAKPILRWTRHREIRAKPAVVPTEPLPVLTTVEQVVRLKPEEAARGYPVKIRGVITSVIERTYVQDATRAIFVSPGRISLRLGGYYELEGVSGRGQFVPELVLHQATCLGLGQMPEPARPSWDQLITGSESCKWIEIQGIVCSITNNEMLVAIKGGTIRVLVGFETPQVLRGFEDAIVRIRGCCGPTYNRNRHVTGVILRVPSTDYLQVETPALRDPFSLPRKTAVELLQFDPDASLQQRVKVEGQITCRGDNVFYLLDNNYGLQFRPKIFTRLEAGDLVQVTGIPESGGLSPVLRQAVARRIGHAPLPKPHQITLSELLANENDAFPVRVEGVLTSLSTNKHEQLLEFQMESRLFLARLNTAQGMVRSVPLGSRVELTGIFLGQNPSSVAVSRPTSFELLLSSPADVIVLKRPSWWSLRNALVLISAMTLVLLLSMAWITQLRRQVEVRTHELKEEIEGHQRAETLLAAEIEERKRMEVEVEKSHKQLLLASHQAGMAEVATSVLHNVGNVLNSVNVSVGLAVDHIKKLQFFNLPKLGNLLQEHAQDPGFLSADQKGRQIPGYLKQLSDHLSGQQQDALRELGSLQQHIDHIKEIVAMQQDYSRLAGLTESVMVSELVEDAVRLNTGALTRHGVQLRRDFLEDTRVVVEKHKVLQILVNLIRNAKYACDESGRLDKQLTLRIGRPGPERLQIQVIDNGIGIAPENLGRLFSQGFTTRKEGHGFGLHSSANAAQELGGSLTAHSDGPGQGAVFILEIPRQSPEAEKVHSGGWQQASVDK